MRYKFATALAVFLLSLCVGIQASQSQVSGTVQFGDGILILHVPGHILTNPIFSPSGNYVFATATRYDPRLDRVFDAKQYLWHIYDSSFAGDVVYQLPNYEVTVDSAAWGSDAAFSPDEQFIGTRNDTEVMLLTMPDLKIARKQPLNAPFIRTPARPYQYVEWSPNGNLLGVIDGWEIVVWDIENNSVARHELPFQFRRRRIGINLFAVESGWMITFRDRNIATTFTTCTWMLEDCRSYNLFDQAHTIFPSPDGQSVFTIDGDIGSPEERVIGLWQREEDGSYEVEIVDFEVEMFNPEVFSNSGEYLLAKYTDDDWAVVEFPSLSLVSRISSGFYLPVWIPDNEHLLSYRGQDNLILQIHKISEDTPTDELQLNKYAEFASTKGRYVDLDVLAESNGKYVLINRGGAFVIVPIEYPD